MVLSTVKNREIDARRELDEREITEAIVSLCKQRRESIRLFKEAGRQELVDKEEAELAVMQAVLLQPRSWHAGYLSCKAVTLIKRSLPVPAVSGSRFLNVMNGS